MVYLTCHTFVCMLWTSKLGIYIWITKLSVLHKSEGHFRWVSFYCERFSLTFRRNPLRTWTNNINVKVDIPVLDVVIYLRLWKTTSCKGELVLSACILHVHVCTKKETKIFITCLRIIYHHSTVVNCPGKQCKWFEWLSIVSTEINDELQQNYMSGVL